MIPVLLQSALLQIQPHHFRVAVHPVLRAGETLEEVWCFLPRHGDESGFSKKSRCAGHEENSFTAAFSRFCDPQIQQGFSQLFFSVFRIHGDAVHDELALSFCQNETSDQAVAVSLVFR